MRNFNLAEDFIDAQAERSLLASLAADPSLQVRFSGRLNLDLFPTEQIVADTILGGIPIDRNALHGWQAASDPEASVALLSDLLKRRRLAGLQEQLAELLYNPAQPVEDAAALIANWRGTETGHAKASVLAATELLQRVLGDAADRVEQRKTGGGPVTGVKTGLAKLDGLLNGLCAGLHVLGGAPGAGKTTLALQIAVHAAATGVRVLYLTFENTPANLLLKAICAEAAAVPLDAERGYADMAKLREASETLGPAFERLAIVEGTLRLTAVDIRAAAANWFQGQRGLLVVDYLQRAAHQQGYEQLRQNVSRLAAELREISSALDSPVLALASQNRSGGDYGRGGGSAQLDSLKESGDLEYSADSVMFLRADKKRTLSEPVRGIELAVVKNRFGPLGAIPLVYPADIGYLREDNNEPVYTLTWFDKVVDKP